MQWYEKNIDELQKMYEESIKLKNHCLNHGDVAGSRKYELKAQRITRAMNHKKIKPELIPDQSPY